MKVWRLAVLSAAITFAGGKAHAATCAAGPPAAFGERVLVRCSPWTGGDTHAGFMLAFYRVEPIRMTGGPERGMPFGTWLRAWYMPRDGQSPTATWPKISVLPSTEWLGLRATATGVSTMLETAGSGSGRMFAGIGRGPLVPHHGSPSHDPHGGIGTQVVPEPSTYLLTAAGLGGLWILGRRRRFLGVGSQ